MLGVARKIVGLALGVVLALGCSRGAVGFDAFADPFGDGRFVPADGGAPIADGVVAPDFDLGAELAEEMHQIVGEAVVVVD